MQPSGGPLRQHTSPVHLRTPPFLIYCLSLSPLDTSNNQEFGDLPKGLEKRPEVWMCVCVRESVCVCVRTCGGRQLSPES